MLQECLESINNFFVPRKAEKREYTIVDGVITPDFGAQEGDRFLICMSRRNDGVYTWHAEGIRDDDDNSAAGLQDETFAGTIRVMSVPPAVIALSGEIRAWVENNSAVLNSPMQSETFNGYSYTLKSSGGNETGGGALTWRDTPAGKRLERWRRSC